MTTEEPVAAEPVIYPPGEGRFIPIGTTKGGITIKASAGETDGQITVYEGVLAPNSGGPARHRHKSMDELIYILEGEVTFEIAGTVHLATAGTHLFIPKGTAHAFRNRASKPARMLVSSLPGGFEGYFDEMLARGSETGAWDAVNRAWDVEVVGSPMDVS